MMTVGETLREGAARLRRTGCATPLLDAGLLLAEVMEISREELLAAYPDTVAPAQYKAFEARIAMRCRGVPVAYLLGRKEFYGLEFAVDSGVLIPRPDSELVVQVALELMTGFGAAARIHDCCTGSGCIAIAIAHACPHADISASDISRHALTIAARNAAHLLPGAVRLYTSDYLRNVPGTFEIITANPPYLTATEIETLATGEPHDALYGGADGLDPYRRLIPEAVEKLSSNGYLVLEAGRDQHEHIKRLLHSAGFRSITHHRDLAGHTRVTVGGMS